MTDSTKASKVRAERNKINFALGKNGGYMPSSLGSRLITVGKQAVNE